MSSEDIADEAEGPLESMLMGEHPRIAAMFRAHRLELLDGRDRDPGLRRAKRRFAEFRATLLDHLEFEEAHVLPAYASVWDDSNDSPPKQFELEHAKLRSLSGSVQSRLQELEGSPESRLDLLDAQVSLRSLLEHHDLRESRVLYPLLSRRLDRQSQDRLCSLRREFRTNTPPADHP